MSILAIVSALLAVCGAIGAVGARRLMRAVTSLALLFIGMAGLFGTLGAPYLAAAQLFLFVGGVVTLLALAFGSAATPIAPGKPLVTLGVAVLGAFIAVALLPGLPDTFVSVTGSQLATALFTRYAPALEVALLIILSGVIGVGYVLGDKEGDR